MPLCGIGGRVYVLPDVGKMAVEDDASRVSNKERGRPSFLVLLDARAPPRASLCQFRPNQIWASTCCVVTIDDDSWARRPGTCRPWGLLRISGRPPRRFRQAAACNRRCFLREGRGDVYARPRGAVPALPAFPRCDSIRNGFRLPSILPRGAAFHPAALFLHIRSRT